MSGLNIEWMNNRISGEMVKPASGAASSVYMIISIWSLLHPLFARHVSGFTLPTTPRVPREYAKYK